MYVYLITVYIRKPTPTLNEWISHVIQRNYFSIDLFNFENMVDWFNAVKGELKIYPGISLTWRNSQYRRATFRFHSKSDVYSHFRPSVNRNRSYIFFFTNGTFMLAGILSVLPPEKNSRNREIGLLFGIDSVNC